MKINYFKASLFVFIMVCALFSFAQKTRRINIISYPIDKKLAKSSFQTIHISNPDIESGLKEYLFSSVLNLKANRVSVQLQQRIESQGAIHYTFEQHVENYKIFRSQIKLNMDKKGNIKSLFDHSFEIHEAIGDFQKLEIFFLNLPIYELADNYKKEFIYFPAENNLIAALRLEIVKGDEYYEIIYNDRGEIIYQHDLAVYFSPQSGDSIASASIFLPDPLTTANVLYGAPYLDQNNSDIAELNAQRILATIKVKYDTAASVFRLENSSVKISEHSLPDIAPASSPVADFSYTRAQSGFEDINVFYHISSFHEYIKSLGFINLVNYPIPADAHALNGQDNSNFVMFPSPRLNFGDGGVDDGEDADVIIHEYGHAISFSAAPYTNTGDERSALDEALGDYLASSYSRSINSYMWENVFSWDGHNSFWDGRSSVSTDHYPEDLQNNLYDDADIWSSTMMEIWADIGKENTDALQLQALYGYAAGMSMADAAQLVIQADSSLNNGVFYNQICTRFFNRGLLSTCETGISEINNGLDFVQLLNTEKFSHGDNATLIFKEATEATIHLYGIGGDMIAAQKIINKNELQISGAGLACGIYLLKISTTDYAKKFKLLKL